MSCTFDCSLTIGPPTCVWHGKETAPQARRRKDHVKLIAKSASACIFLSLCAMWVRNCSEIHEHLHDFIRCMPCHILRFPSIHLSPYTKGQLIVLATSTHRFFVAQTRWMGSRARRDACTNHCQRRAPRLLTLRRTTCLFYASIRFHHLHLHVHT